MAIWDTALATAGPDLQKEPWAIIVNAAGGIPLLTNL